MKIELENGVTAEEQMQKLSRRSFIWAGISVIGVVTAVKLLANSPKVEDIPGPFRKSHALNQAVWSTYFSTSRLSPEFTEADITKEPKSNGNYGVTPATREEYALDIEGAKGEKEAIQLSFDDILAMPSKTMITQFCCIEGWSQIVQWKGVPLMEVLKMHEPEPVNGKPPEWIYMESIDEEYYVAIDMLAALHPQTMLAYEMNGHPLEDDHGAPLRLIIPTKYGVKNIKCVALIRYTNERPKDYWAERGYDYYCGL